MKQFLLSVLVVISAGLLSTAYAADTKSAPSAAAKAGEIANDTQRISYTLGADMAINFKGDGIKIDADALAQGLKDGFAGSKLRYTQQEMQQTLAVFQEALQKKRLQALKRVSDENAEKSEAFLAANKKKRGVVSLPNGLQYKILKKGKGEKPTLNDVVTVNYEGRLIDGRVFDSSFKHGKPATFPLNKVIEGWQKAIQLMPTGSSWEIYIPAKLAYGELGIGGIIGPNQLLIFKVDLLAVEHAKT